MGPGGEQDIDTIAAVKVLEIFLCYLWTIDRPAVSNSQVVSTIPAGHLRVRFSAISESSMRIALAQLNPTVGDLKGNCLQIEQAHQAASQNRAELVVSAELGICGYPPKDLLLRDGFVDACQAAVERLAGVTKGQAALLVGHPSRGENGTIHNSASLLADGHIVARIHKTLLPNYDVFDERRYFRPQRPERLKTISFGGRKLGVISARTPGGASLRRSTTRPRSSSPTPSEGWLSREPTC